MLSDMEVVMKIVYITARQPYPYAKGDQVIAYNQIKELSKKHEVYLITYYKTDYNVFLKEMSKYCTDIFTIEDNSFMKIVSMLKTPINLKPLQVNMFYRKSVDKYIRKIIREISPDIIHTQTIRMAEYSIESTYKKSIDFIDALSWNMKQRFEVSPFFLKPLWYVEYKLLQKYEQEVMSKFKLKTVVSHRDKTYLKDKRILVNAVGVKMDSTKSNMLLEKTNLCILFHGNMSYYPNVDGVKYLINRVFDRLQKMYPGVKLIVMGANPTNELLKYENSNIEFTRYVKDREYYFEKADIAIYPIFSATGTQTKVLEALYYGLPCIVSRECADGIPELISKENVLIADTDKEYVDSFIEIVENIDLYKKLSVNGRKMVQRHYSWGSNVNALIDMWEKM